MHTLNRTHVDVGLAAAPVHSRVAPLYLVYCSHAAVRAIAVALMHAKLHNALVLTAGTCSRHTLVQLYVCFRSQGVMHSEARII